ncbi:helix-turn-helix domain-containing protein [Streptomyces sp. 5-6(2022)]|uniref:helix-turn-helix domain-containing protein n=1 Tax=Streptomyces sp. 5-6(2022) TaxID=2936510 RepID=UPI0023B923B2|nr:helix-turn-helix domain-containing protein [Streptomyces sp. 5-6(2022)]
MSAPSYLTTKEVAERYRTAESTVRYWRHVGYIPGGMKRGRRVLYNEAVLDAWDAEQETGGQAA